MNPPSKTTTDGPSRWGSVLSLTTSTVASPERMTPPLASIEVEPAADAVPPRSIPPDGEGLAV